MLKNDVKMKRDSSKPWPENCPWAEPLFGGCGIIWEEDMIPTDGLDEEAEDLLDIKYYYDGLVQDGILNDDYILAEQDFDDDPDDEFEPEIGEEYWTGEEFDIDAWLDDMTEHLNLIKVDLVNCAEDAVAEIQRIIGYTFINENLLRQAFTRRAFQVEYGLSGCSEELELIGDSVLNMCVTRDMAEQLTEIDITRTDAPFKSDYNEGALSKLREHYISKDYLAERACSFGLDKYILYGTGEEHSENSKEDVVESLIGAVAIDCNWDMDTIREVVDKLICVQLQESRSLLEKTYYEIFNSWHQKHFGCIPDYEIYGKDPYYCAIRFSVPENDKGIRTMQRIDIMGATRGKARELAAELAYRFVVIHGLWKNIKEAGITPELENSINQMQELYQKGYLDEKPRYVFEDEPEIDIMSGREEWKCTCICDGIETTGYSSSKTGAKKEAAYEILRKIFADETKRAAD